MLAPEILLLHFIAVFMRADLQEFATAPCKTPAGAVSRGSNPYNFSISIQFEQSNSIRMHAPC
jgi:hypothetical protein